MPIPKLDLRLVVPKNLYDAAAQLHGKAWTDRHYRVLTNAAEKKE